MGSFDDNSSTYCSLSRPICLHNPRDHHIPMRAGYTLPFSTCRSILQGCRFDQLEDTKKENENIVIVKVTKIF